MVIDTEFASGNRDTKLISMARNTNDVDFLDIEEVKTRVRCFRSKGQYLAGFEYISQLPEVAQTVKAIAIEIAQLFLVQGHYTRAAQACIKAASPIFPENWKDQELAAEVWDEDSVCLELLRAYIDISRLSKLRTAVSIATRIKNIWLVPEGAFEIGHSLGV